MELDLEAILKIMDKFDHSEMTEFEYENDAYTFRLKSEKKQEYIVPSAAPVLQQQESTLVAPGRCQQKGTQRCCPEFHSSSLPGNSLPDVFIMRHPRRSAQYLSCILRHARQECMQKPDSLHCPVSVYFFIFSIAIWRSQFCT